MTTIDRLLSIRVDFRDDAAAAEIAPERAAAYLTKGWTERVPERSRRGPPKMRIFARVPESERLNYLRSGRASMSAPVVMFPREAHWVDYGRRMVELVNDVAVAEGRSPLAVWWEMMEQKT